MLKMGRRRPPHTQRGWDSTQREDTHTHTQMIWEEKVVELQFIYRNLCVACGSTCIIREGENELEVRSSCLISCKQMRKFIWWKNLPSKNEWKRKDRKHGMQREKSPPMNYVTLFKSEFLCCMLNISQLRRQLYFFGCCTVANTHDHHVKMCIRANVDHVVVSNAVCNICMEWIFAVVVDFIPLSPLLLLLFAVFFPLLSVICLTFKECMKLPQ